jgi:hypothetical protein
MRNAAIALFVLLTIIGFSLAHAQPGCATTSCVYLPTITTPGPSVLPVTAWYTSGNGSTLSIVGEIDNPTTFSLDLTNVTVNIFDATNQLIATDRAFTWLDHIAPGDKTCFRATLDTPAGWKSYQFEAVNFYRSSRPPLTLGLEQVSARFQNGTYQILGFVRNTQAAPVKYVQVTVTMYNSAGFPIGCDFTYTNSNTIMPGQTSSFSLTKYGNYWLRASSYRLQTDGTIATTTTVDDAVATLREQDKHQEIQNPSSIP